jgi:hypothetical protein
MFAFESFLNKLYTFYYSHGHKRKAHLIDTAMHAGMEKVLALNYIFEVRWISSEKMAVMRVIDNWKLLVSDLEGIVRDDDDEGFKDDIIQTATGMLATLKDRNFLAILHFMGDLLNHLSYYSKKMQQADGLLIDQTKNMEGLLDSMKQISGKEDTSLNSLLIKSVCDSEPGCTLSQWEDPQVSAKFDGVDLSYGERKFKKLTKIRYDLVTGLIQELQSYFPASEISTYSILKPSNFPEEESERYLYGVTEISKLSTTLQLPIVDTVNEWRELMEFVIKDPEFCRRKEGQTKLFWRHFLNPKVYNSGNNIAYLIKSVMVTPIGSADAERGFSTLFHIRNKRRARLSRQTLEDFVRLRMNTPKDLKKFPAVHYAKKWVGEGHFLTDDITRTHVPINKRPSAPLIDDEDQTEGSQLKSFLDGSNLF